MLVYGDPQFKAQGGCIRKHLESLLIQPVTGQGALDFWRMALIRAGQMEQGIADAHDGELEPSVVREAEHLTDLVAEAFLEEWFKKEHVRRPELTRCLKLLEAVDELGLKIKVPEGYEFYALFPEQYVCSALAWSDQHGQADCKDVLVVGIRSIGTSLSAVVAAALRGAGWNARRVTVRPKGHPFQRKLTLQTHRCGQTAFALIVDEGPGISGSSMAAVAEALVNARFLKSKLAFFPGHGNEPGYAASEKVREWWRTVPRFFAPLERLKWDGRPLKEILSFTSQALLDLKRGNQTVQKVAIQDLAGGGWLPLIFPERKDWPPVFWPFERLKFRCVSPEGQAVFWKFSGLGALVGPAEQSAGRSRTDEKANPDMAVQTLPVLASTHGFLCTRWTEAIGASPAHAESHILGSIAQYLVRTALDPLGAEESAEAVKRLCSMLICNSREQFEEDAARRAEKLTALIQNASSSFHLASMPACADGRMAPHEWLLTNNRCLVKTDSTGNLVDHTVIGRQPLVWDVAGVITEWRLGPEQSALFGRQLREQGLRCESEALEFYLAAYAAFKLGQSVLCVQMGSPDLECSRRMQRAASYYSSRLKSILTVKRCNRSRKAHVVHNL